MRMPQLLVCSLGLVLFGPPCAGAQSGDGAWLPALQPDWGNSDTWTVVTPTQLDVDPDRFVGLRAVYHREWNLLRDPQGEDMIFQFERGVWRGEPVLTARFYAAGVPHDTVAGKPGWFSGIVMPRTLRMMNLSSGGPWGFTVTEVSETGIASWRKPPRDGADWIGPTVTEGHGPVFFLDQLSGQVLSSLPLEEGLTFRVATYRGGNVVHVPHRVAGKTRISDLSGRTHEVWAVESASTRDGWLTIHYVSDRAPYDFGSESRHVDTGQVRYRSRLKSFQRLNG